MAKSHKHKSPLHFEVTKRSRKSQARLGTLITAHGTVETPTLVPVATQATIKTLWSEQVERTGTQLVIANTFHLHLKPGEQIVKASGGLHEFMQWSHPIMTDSAGYQVFSLGFGKDHQVGKIAKVAEPNKRAGGRAGSAKTSERHLATVGERDKPREIKISDKGVLFRSPVDGREVFIGPRESMRIQAALGADIIFAFDECTPPNADHAYTERSLERTHRWAEISLREHDPRQALYGVVQGGRFKDLRQKSARALAALPFDGFGIGGEFGADKKTMSAMIKWVLAELPDAAPRHLLGIGHLDDIKPIIKAGVDTFDCIVPTHYARHGVAFTRRERLNLKQSVYLRDRRPIDRTCTCFVCKNYTRSYLTHLYKAHELTGLALTSFHNLHLFNTYVAEQREQIRAGKL